MYNAAYINGFIKRAADYGFSRVEAENIFKEAAMKVQPTMGAPQPTTAPESAPSPAPSINQQDGDFLNGGADAGVLQYNQAPQAIPFRGAMMGAAPAVPQAQPVTASVQPVMPENPAGPSNDYLTKVMGSYNPKSKLDQQKANRIRQIYRPNMKPNEIYRDPQYSAIK